MFRWHGLPTMEAKGLNVWRVTSEGTKRNSQQEKQYDAIAKCAILNCLGENVFNRVFACENAKILWKTISENYEGTKDIANEKYHVLIDKLNSFKQLDHCRYPRTGVPSLAVSRQGP